MIQREVCACESDCWRPSGSRRSSGADGTLRLLDQRLLPQEEVWLEHESAAEVAKAIRDMVVRGAPAIGISAAYGIVLGAARAWRRAATGAPRWRRTPPAGRLATHGGQPVLALNRMRDRLERMKEGDQPLAVLEAEAISIHESDREANLTMASWAWS